MRRAFEMTQADLDRILEACRPPAYLVVGGMGPTSQQERANAAWQELGDRMGFDYMTVQPAPGGDRFFTAEEKASSFSPDPEFQTDLERSRKSVAGEE